MVTSTQEATVPPFSETEDNLHQVLDKLARERPPKFPTRRSELGFCFALFMTQILTEYFVSGFNIILPTLIADLHIERPSSVWPATAFSLSVASTLLVFGRLGDRYGAYVVHVFGLGWLTVWSVIAGFSANPFMLIICRALQGIGPAAFLPTGVMLIGSTYRPGPRKNLVFSLYGSAAVAGFYIGIFFAGLIGQHARWGWYFWVGAILSVITLAAALCFIPDDRALRARDRQTSKVDCVGAGLIVSGIILLVFSLTQWAHASTKGETAYISSLFVVSIVLLLLAGWYESRATTEQPILPPDIFAVPCMTPLTIALLLLYGTLGIYLVYGTQFFVYFMGVQTLQVVAWYTPMALGGILLAVGEGYLLDLVPGRVLLICSGLGALGSQLLLSFVPVNGNYWAWIMPSMVLGTIGIDLSITLVMVFVTTNLPVKRQGLAGGMVNSVMQLGMALCIGISDIVMEKTSVNQGDAPISSFRYVFYFGSVLGGTSLVLMAIWGKVPKATSELTADEKIMLERELRTEIVKAQPNIPMIGEKGEQVRSK